MDLCLTQGRQIVSDAEGQASGGAPWLQNDVRRAARCWLPTRDRPRRRRQHGSGRCHLARRDRGKNDHMNFEGANGPDLPLKECRTRREWLRGAEGASATETPGAGGSAENEGALIGRPSSRQRGQRLRCKWEGRLGVAETA